MRYAVVAVFNGDGDETVAWENLAAEMGDEVVYLSDPMPVPAADSYGADSIVVYADDERVVIA